MPDPTNPFGARDVLQTSAGPVEIYRLERLQRDGLGQVDRLPFSIRILLESALRQCDHYRVTEEDVRALAGWTPKPAEREIPFLPARVLLQDLTGVPAVVDLAAMRSALRRLGGDPARINPLNPVDLVIDHSVQVDAFGSADAIVINVEREFERNRERYALLRWAQKAFRNLRVVPPDTGIVHQVNLEFLATVVSTRQADGRTVAFPDSLVGTDSHTPMVNGLGVLGWGVGGIEAEANMLGQPFYLLLPEVVGVRLTGALRDGVTATDLVLTVTEMLRRHGVVGKFVEFFGPGLGTLALPDRATIANMAPEYGATIGFFPTDDETLAYLRVTGRSASQVALVDAYCKAQGLFRTDATPEPEFSEVLTLDLSTVEPSLAGPKRPQDRVALGAAKQAFRQALAAPVTQRGFGLTEDQARRVVPVRFDGASGEIGHGAVVIAAITSCTNTSNPTVMIGAGLLAKKAIERGLAVPRHVKTSMAPGSRVVTEYLRASGLLAAMERLGFHVVGYGCTTCIGNSGPLPEAVAAAIREGDLVAAAVLSGNRNFEGRIHPQVRANYLASPPLVVAYALAGRIDVDLTREPLGTDRHGRPVFLRDIWPTQQEIREAIHTSLRQEQFRQQYGQVFEGNERWRTMPVPEGEVYEWDPASTYIQEPPFFVDLSPEPQPPADIIGARALVVLGDSITTDHISPAGAIAVDSPAGRYLIDRGVRPADFNTYGARRGNHEVMVRGTFGNIRLKNLMLPGTEGPKTVHLPSRETMFIYDAAMRYRQEGVPLVVIAGKEYGSGSSRDWAAKGPYLLGVRAVIAESYERIHRSNLVGMGVLPLQFADGQGRETLGLTGFEVYDIEGPGRGLAPRQRVRVRARRDDGSETTFDAVVRIDAPVEVEYYRHGGILNMMLRQLLRA
ncbi:MAG: aconitate hydratase AcnA [Armatimonadota bacterium]|nr:aconitate hydratase AcnA [Armatimonadota bacterium]MDR7549685.1 aconitate hydratase AcnA [Armatimonadota bacterium]